MKGNYLTRLWAVPLTAIGLAGAPAAVVAQPAEKMPNEVCLSCHGNEGFGVPGPDGKMRALHVVKDRFEQSVHGKRMCVE
ncbi:MAG TPA: hypothetical protein VGA12_03860, partial [Burkholderiales bacterium]